MTRTLLWTAALVLTWSTQAAAVHWSLGKRSDEELVSFIEKLEAVKAAPDGAQEEGAVVLYQTGVYQSSDDDGFKIGHNRVIYVLDESAADVHVQTVSWGRGQKLNFAHAWIARANGSLERLDEDIEITKATDSSPAQMVIAYPGVQPGDTLAYSYELGSRGVLSWAHYNVTQRYPVRYSRITLVTDATLAYRLQGRNLQKDSFTHEVVEKEDRVATHVRMTIKNTPARRTDAFALPDAARDCQIVIYYRGFLLEFFQKWILNESWPQVALTAEHLIADGLDSGGEIDELAAEIAGAHDTPQEQADAIYRFVRDEIVSTYVGELRRNQLSAEKTLKARAGTPLEKALLLASMLRSRELIARIGFGRSSYLGPLDHTNPGLWQFDTYMVRVPGDVDRWYEPACSTCPPGSPSSEIAGTPVWFVYGGANEKSEKLLKRLIKEHHGNFERIFNQYLYAIPQQEWCGLLTAPEEFVEGRAWLRETVTLGHDEPRIELEGSHFSLLGTIMRSYPDPQECLDEYLQRRFQSASALSVDHSERLEGAEVECRLAGTIDASVPPPVDDSTWVLTADLVYGVGTFDHWEGPERGPYHLPNSTSLQSELRIPLPDGWQDVELPRAVTAKHDRFDYEARFRVDAGALVIARQIELHAGTASVRDLPHLDRCMAAVIELEESPLVVRRLDP